MARSVRPAVVAGIDGSPAGWNALDWAIAEAGARRLPLLVVHAVPVGLGPEAIRQAEVMLADAVGRAQTREVDVGARFQPDFAVPALLAAARDATVVVVGACGLGGFREFRLGSVAPALARYASCPVVVVRDPGVSSPGHRVVVGVDGSGGSMRALGYACEEASLRDLPLAVVLVWNEPEPPWPALGPPGPAGWEEIVEQARRALAETVAGWQEKYPDVPITTTLALGHPAQVLVEEARDAALLVVGARGRPDMSGLALGSVSYTVMLHARSPVAVVQDQPGEQAY